MKNVIGKFGFSDERLLPCTLGLNEKGGMDEQEFEKCLFNSLVPLHPDSRDVKGKRVMTKIDSGPGRLNRSMLARLRNRGFCLHPGVPNTTAVTQETDQNCGLFKTIFRRNLDEITNFRVGAGESVSLQPWLVGLIVFGGTDPTTGQVLQRDACAEAFAINKNLEAWAKVGAAPLTCACLNSSKVRHEAGDDDDPLSTVFKNMQHQNDLSGAFLEQLGCKASLLQAKSKPMTGRQQRTEPHSKERLELLAKAKSHGATFHACQGDHATSNCGFLGAELKIKQVKISEMEAHRKARLEKEAKETKCLATMQL